MAEGEDFAKFLGIGFGLILVIAGMYGFASGFGDEYDSQAWSDGYYTEPVVGDEEEASLWLHTDGIYILNSEDEVVIFNGVTSKTLFGYGWYGQDPLDCFVEPDDIALIRGYGMNSIRIDIQLNVATHLVDYNVQTPTNLTYYTRFWEVLDDVVDACVEEGMWCIIDYGHTDGVWSPQDGFWGTGNGLPEWMYNGSWSYFSKTYPNNVTGRDSAIRDFWNLTNTDIDPVRDAYQTFWVDIATRYRDYSNVVFCLFNEPMNQWGGETTLWDNQTEGIVYYNDFIEETVDLIRAVEDEEHLIISNVAYFWDWASTPKIDRSNVVVTAHSYSGITQDLVDYGWDYDQPFMFGEFGGIDIALMTEEETEADIDFCNTNGVGWGYLHYDVTNGYPSSGVWSLLESNLVAGIRYYGVV